MDLGIALNRAAVEAALGDEARVLHAARHLVEAGIVKEGTNAAKAAATRTIAADILNRPITSFITRIGLGSGEAAVRVYVGSSAGRLIGVAIVDAEGAAVARGQLLTTLILH